VSARRIVEELNQANLEAFQRCLARWAMILLPAEGKIFREERELPPEAGDQQ